MMSQTNLCHRVISDYLRTSRAAKPVEQLLELKPELMDVIKCLDKVNKLIFQGVLEFILHLFSCKGQIQHCILWLKTTHSFLLSVSEYSRCARKWGYTGEQVWSQSQGAHTSLVWLCHIGGMFLGVQSWHIS